MKSKNKILSTLLIDELNSTVYKLKKKSMDDNQFIYAFGMLANALEGGGNKNQAFPEDDAIDFSNGARYIPGEVTLARRRGEKVVFDPANHEWKMPDNSIIK